jgi:hypothetical protein
LLKVEMKARTLCFGLDRLDFPKSNEENLYKIAHLT